MQRVPSSLFIVLILSGLLGSVATQAQTENPNPTPSPEAVLLEAAAGPSRTNAVGTAINFDASASRLPPSTRLEEVLWDFGDGVRTTGQQVSHTYRRSGNYLVTLTISTDQGTSQDTTEVRIFDRLIILVIDASAPADEVRLLENQAAKSGVWLRTIAPKGSGPEILIAEDLAQQLLDIRDDVAKAQVIATWTSGSVGATVLSKFAQHLRQAAGINLADVALAKKGVLLLTETPFAVLVPTAQSVFDQLRPAYVLLTRPPALELVLSAETVEAVQTDIINSPVEYRLLGAFSERTIRDISPTNFISYGINFIINRGVPINSIVLLLMLPVIATILALARQVIGIKAFGLVTPAMTTLAFLVMGLRYGLLVFGAVLLSGTLTRLILRKLHLLYLPRMALVLTSVSLAILALLGLGLATDKSGVLSFSIFPALILVILAEEFIALQFTSGAKRAFNITLWTLLLAIACYLIVSWELFRTLILSYPELVLLALPINILLGRWSGLRLTEYLRFREVIRYGSTRT